jgi:hypothetical protein
MILYEYHYSIDGEISDIDGDGIADELDNLDDRLVGSWMGSVDLNFESDGNYNANSGSINGTWETRFDTILMETLSCIGHITIHGIIISIPSETRIRLS